MACESTNGRVASFGSILSEWKKAEDKTGAAPFPTLQSSWKTEKDAIARQNVFAIKEYKKTFKAKKFKAKTPTRGMSVYTKPAQLQNVFGANILDDELSSYVSPVFEKTDAEWTLIQEAVEKNFFFEDLSKSQLKAFVKAFEPATFDKGAKIITQGEVGDYFYILSEGLVHFNIGDEKVGCAESGASFGELALLYACPRAATVQAQVSPTKVFRVDQTTFRSLLQKQTKVMEAKKTTLLKSIDFLKELGEWDIKRLGRAMSPKVFEEGDYLVKKGEAGDAFYVIHEGEVKVTDISVGDTSFEDVTLKEGEYFGERSLITNEPRAANVTAVTKGTAFCIDRATFERVLGKFSRLIMKSQDRRILEAVDVLNQCSLEPKQFEELAQSIVDKTFEANEVIFDPLNDTKAALYLLREGSVQLSGQVSKCIKPGGYFGEDSLLLDTRQPESSHRRHSQTSLVPMYTAIATGKCDCGVLSLSDCRTIFDTRTMVDTKSYNNMTILESQPDVSDEELAPTAVAPPKPTGSLARETTKQWLAKVSKKALRTSVQQEIALHEFERHSVLGEGQFGEVWLVSVDVPGEYGKQHFALKSQKKEDPTRGDSKDAIKREIDVLGLMDHPYIVNLVHWYEDPEHIYIVMGLVYGGELFDVIHTQQDDGTWSSGIPESDAKFYAMVVADTLDYIHRKQFVYRDLKPENILIDKDGYPIICDFGFAKFVADKTYTLCGTPNYLSPEVVMNRGHNASSDHFALGVIIYEMVAGENPFYYDGMPQLELFETIVREKFYPLPDEVSDECFYVVDELLEKDPTQRLGSLAGRGKDIIAKDWFRDLDLDDLRQKKYRAPFIPQNTRLVDAMARSLMPNIVSPEPSEGSANSLDFTCKDSAGHPIGSHQYHASYKL